MIKNTNILKSNIIMELEDYMFTSINIDRLTKHMIHIDLKPKSSSKNIPKVSKNQIVKTEESSTPPIEKVGPKKEIVKVDVPKVEKVIQDGLFVIVGNRAITASDIVNEIKIILILYISWNFQE